MTITKERMIELCQGQLEAYNNRNLEQFVQYYHPETKAFRLQTGEQMFSGMDALKVLYHKRFSENSNLHCELKSRIVLESSVLDEEWVTGVTGQEKPTHVVAIYQFKDNLIHSIWFTR